MEKESNSSLSYQLNRKKKSTQSLNQQLIGIKVNKNNYSYIIINQLETQIKMFEMKADTLADFTKINT